MPPGDIWTYGAAMSLVTFCAGILALLAGRNRATWLARPMSGVPGPSGHEGHAGHADEPRDHGHAGHGDAAAAAHGAHLPSGALGLFLAFTAGFMLGACFLHLLPEAAADIGTNAGLYALGGFLVIHLLERYLLVHPCGESDCDFHTLGWTAAGGLFACEAADGFSLASAVAARAPLPVFLPVLAHKIPEVLILTRLLLAGGWPLRRVMVAILAFAVAAPTVALVVQALVLGAEIQISVRGTAMAISGGLMLAIATGDLLPEVHRRGPRRLDHLLAILSGVAMMWVVHHFCHAHPA